ncbi:MAG: hypothetical protein ABFS45_13270 [Pseudomonadota bacterium]
MTKSEDKLSESMHVLKTATCKTLSGKSTLTYQIGCTPDSVIHLRITKNDGGGFFSLEWIAFEDIQKALKDRPEGSPVLSHFITPLLKGKSVNTSAFLLAALSHLKMLRPLPGKKHQHELLDSRDFMAMLDKLMSSSEIPTKKTVRKATVKKASTKKAAIKKRAIAKKKSTPA